MAVTHPYGALFPNKIQQKLTIAHRSGAYPMDDTSVWADLDQLTSYISEDGSYAYPGQLVTVANGSIDSSNGGKDYTVAVIRSDGTYQVINSDLIFANIAAAQNWIAANPDAAVSGLTFSVQNGANAYQVFVINVDKSYTRINFEQSDITEVTWEALTGKPTSTVDSIDHAAVVTADVTVDSTSAYFKTQKLAFAADIPTTYDATKITGTIPVGSIPAAVIERISVVADIPAMLAMSITTVQNGDTVKIASTGQMFFVKDDSKLGTIDAFEEYKIGEAAKVVWTGVYNTPTTMSGYGITDAVNTTQLSTTAAADKIAVYNGDGELATSITGDAATVGGFDATHFAVATDVTTLQGTVTGNSSAITSIQSDVANAQSDIVDLKAGTAITGLDASKITGTLSPDVLPKAALGGALITVPVGNITAVNAADVNPGDFIHLGDHVFYVTTSDSGVIHATVDSAAFTTLITGANTAGDIYIGPNNAIYAAMTTGTATAIALSPQFDYASAPVDWARLYNTPTTVAGYGITDAVRTTDTSNTPVAGKVVKYDSNAKLEGDITGDAATLGTHNATYFAKSSDLTTVSGNLSAAQTDIVNLKSGAAITALDSSKLSGMIDIARIPPAVIERLSIVADEAGMLALTVSNVQNGDSVKQTSTSKMFMVKDDSKLGTLGAFEEYTVGSAATVPWVGVTGKPTTLSGYGITDAISNTLLTTTASAANIGKILVLNATGQLDVSITGAIDWSQLINKPTSSVAAIDAAIATATHSNRAVLDALSDAAGVLKYNDTALATKSALDQIALGSLAVVDTLPTGVSANQLVLHLIA